MSMGRPTVKEVFSMSIVEYACHLRDLRSSSEKFLLRVHLISTDTKFTEHLAQRRMHTVLRVDSN